MRLASVLTLLSDYHLRLAAQCGVEDIVIRYPGPELADLLAVKGRIESFGLRGSVVEGYLPIPTGCGPPPLSRNAAGHW